MKRLLILLLLLLPLTLSAQTVQTYDAKTTQLVWNDGDGGHASVVYTVPRGWVPLGYARYTPSTVKALTDAPVAGVALPATARHAIIYVKSAEVNYRDDGTAPTATEGIPMSAGTAWIVENSRDILTAIRFIDVSGASDVRIAYYKSLGE